MSFSIGQQVGPYRIEDKLGQGGMATVYKAHHATLDRYVAIKVMHIALSEDESFLVRFKREAQIVGKLAHPHIIPIYDYAAFENQPYLVMQFVEGQTLKQRMRRQPLTLDQVAIVLDAVAGALDYAHENDVLHRDVKPSNIMLDRAGHPYLTDFGLARIASLGESTLSADMMLGTPQYISPEQAQGLRNLDSGTDIYSLGVVLYELVVGRVPFTADTPYTIIHDHIYKPLPLPTELNHAVPPPIEDVLIRVLSKERTKRYGSAGSLAKAFREAVKEAKLGSQVAPRSTRSDDLSASSFQRQAAEDSSPSRSSEALMTPDGIPIEIITPAPADRRTESSARKKRESRVATRTKAAPPPFPTPTSATPTSATPTPSPGIPSPVNAPPGSVLVPGSSVNFRVESTGNGWTIAGCLIFIFACLFSGAVVLGAVNDDRFMEEWEDVQARIADEQAASATPESDPLSVAVTEGLREAALEGTLSERVIARFSDGSGDTLELDLARALLLYEADDTEQASTLLADVLGRDAVDVEILLDWAEAFARAGFDEGVGALYLQAMQAAPDNAMIVDTAESFYYDRLLELAQTGALDIEDVEQFQRLFPDSVEGMVLNAIVLAQGGDMRAAQTVVNEALEADEDVAIDAMLDWADLLMAGEEYESATLLYRVALAAAPDDEETSSDVEADLSNLLLEAARAGQLSQEMVNVYQELFPESITGDFAQAFIYIELGNREETLATLQLRLFSGVDQEILMQWADVMARKGYDEPATLLYLMAYVIDLGLEDDERLTEIDVRNEAGVYLYNQALSSTVSNVSIFCNINEQLAQLPFVQVLTAQALISADYSKNRILILRNACPNLGMLSSPLTILNNVREENPNLAEVYLVIGNFYAYNGQMERARDSWELALEMDTAPDWVKTRARNALEA